MKTPELTEAHIIALKELYRKCTADLQYKTEDVNKYLYARDQLDAIELILSLHNDRKAAQSDA